MRKIRAIISVLLLLCLASGLCACSGGGADEPTTAPTGNKDNTDKTESTITLPVAHNDTLDPFKAKSDVNRRLIPLLYDGLVEIDGSFDPQPVLMSTAVNEGKTLTVELKSAMFSDGTGVSAEDVVYSFNQAVKSDCYSARLQNFSSAAQSGRAVVFTLKIPDINAVSCLDFPIVKKGTVEPKYESKKLYNITPPVGTGRYTVSGELPNASLIANGLCPRNVSPQITSIKLFEVSDSDGMTYGLEIGNYDFWYDDLSGGEYIRVNSGMSVVQTNNLVFIGFNSEKSILAEAPVRRAISQLIDREVISSQGYQGHAAPSLLPFNPVWSAMKNVPVSGKTSAQEGVAKATLEQEGYTSVNVYGYRCSRTKSLNATLTVCKDNKFKLAIANQIKEQLGKLNFNVKIIELGFKDYKRVIEAGEYEMYLGEIKIPANMNLSAFFSPGGEAYTESVLADGYYQVLAGELSLSDFARGFEDEMPFVPLCYRSGMAVYSRSISASTQFTCYDGFYGIDKWTVK